MRGVEHEGVMTTRDCWPLYRDLRALCIDLGYHASVAGNLAPVLEVMGCETLADVYGMDVAEIAQHRGIGRLGISLARAVGAVGMA